MTFSGHDLDLRLISRKINEYELRSSSSDGVNTSSQGHSNVVFEYTILCALTFIFLSELVNSVRAREFVWIRITTLIPQTLDKLFPVVSVLGWINFFFYFWLRLASRLWRGFSFFSLFLC